jgi:DNA-binding MarR family transcriptional regulator
VVNSVPDDSQLEQLLTQLLRAVSPALGAERPQAAVAQTTGAGTTVTGTTGAGTTGTDAATPKAAPPEAYAEPDPASATGTAVAPAEVPASDGAGLPTVTGSEARALIELMSARGIAQGELAALLGLDKSTVSRLAAGLERKGWIRRGRDEENQRYVRLYLTAAGAEVADRVWQAWQSRQARILAALSDDERSGLSAGLRGLVRGLAAEGLLSEVRGGGSEP